MHYAIKLFFAHVRQLDSWNENPDVQKFNYAIRTLLMKNVITANFNAKC